MCKVDVITGYILSFKNVGLLDLYLHLYLHLYLCICLSSDVRTGMQGVSVDRVFQMPISLQTS